eukprot:Phypoly_transcript_10789.p1 GENE.Phypoly_transcript_10789~~Phypoly_transcript_10789.p1  ORF type:complete len:357 (+),score=38.21 Phypoly_transcript_10789:151-1221(+)
MAFAEHVVATLKGRTGGTSQELKETLAKFEPQICEKYQVLPYVQPESMISTLRNFAMANTIRFFEFSTSDSFNFDHFHLLEPIFSGTGPDAEVRLQALMRLTIGAPDSVFESLCALKDLKLVNSGTVCNVPFDEMKKWTLRLFNHPRGKLILQEMVGFSYPRKRQVDLEKLISTDGIHFFTHSDASLYSFSGMGTIYVNLHAIEKAHEYAKKIHTDPSQGQGIWKTEECFEMQVKMICAVVGYYEVVFMAIRMLVDNLNDEDTDFLKHRFIHYNTSNAGVIALIRLLDLPPIHWNTLTSNQGTIPELFQFFANDTLSPPKISDLYIHTLDSATGKPPTYFGLYRTPARMGREYFIY